MSALTNTYARVVPDTRGFGPQVNRELSRVDASSAGRRVGGTFTNGLKSGLAGVAKVATASFATIAAGAVSAGAFGLKIASQNEQAQISFETMLGSATKAKKFLGQLQAFAAKTPFEFPELQTAASSLISAGVEASKVIPIMTSLGNATSGMGTGSEGVKRATVALQQMSAAGKITGEDLNQLRDAGVPVFDLLAAATGKSKAAIAELAQSGKLGKKELDQLFKALESGKGLERFSGLMDKQSASLAGMLSTFKDTFGQGLANAIAPALPTIKNGLASVSKQAEGFFAGLSGKGKLAGFSGTVNQVGLGLRAMVLSFREGDVTSDGLVGKFERLGVKFRQVFDYVTGTAIPAARQFFASFRTGGAQSEQVGKSFGSIATSLAKIGPAVQGASTSLPSFADSLTVGARALEFLADNIDTVVKYMPLLVAGIVAYKVAQVAANVAQVVAVPTKIAEVIVNRQLVASNRALIASRTTLTASVVTGTVVEGASTAAKNAGIIATVRQRIAMVASTAATKAVAAATLVWAGVQRVLNLVLRANPIGLVITAIALLAAGVIYAYKNSETFRRIVDGAFRGVAAAGKFMWENVLRPTFRFLVAAWFAVAGSIVNGAAKAFGWVPGIGGKLKDAAAAFNRFRDNVNASLAGVKSRTVSVTARVAASTQIAGGVDRRTAISDSIGRAMGGRVFGAGTATSDSIPAMLSNGEHVWTAREVAKAGGHASVERLRGAAAAGALPRFAAGGRVGFEVAPRLEGMAKFESALTAFNTRVDGMARKLAAAQADFGGGRVSPGLTGALAFARSQAGKPYIWGSAGPSGYDCCIIGTVRVYSPDGARAISEVQAGDRVFSYEDGKLTVSTVSNAWRSADQPVFAVRTRNRTVTASANHPFMVLRQVEPARHVPGGRRGEQVPARFDVQWLRLDELRRGDLLVQPRAMEPDVKPDARLHDGTTVDADVAWLLGAILGDGTVTPKGLRLALYGNDRDRAADILREHWGGTPTYTASAGIVLSNARLRDVLIDLGMRLPGPDKRVPEAVWMWAPELRRGFLDGYCDADGHRPADPTRHGDRTYHSASRDLVEDIRALHVMLGDPVSNITTTVRRGDIVIRGKVVKNARDLHSFTVWPGKGRGEAALRKRPGIAAWLDRGDFTVSSVLAVDAHGVQATYDLEVEGAHNFVADGVVVHNSGFMAAITNVARGRNPYARIGSTATFPWGGFRPGTGAFTIGSTSNAGGGIGHMAGTLNGVNVESRGGRGVVIGGAARGARHPLFNERAYLAGFARGGRVLPGDAPFDVLARNGRAFRPGLLEALAEQAKVMDSGGTIRPGWNPPIYNGTGRGETVTTAQSMDAVIAELRALRRDFANLPAARVDGRLIKREYDNQTARNPSGW